MLRLLFANNPLPLWIYDLETLRFFGCYDVACQTYRYTREEFLTLTIRDILPQEDVPQLGVSVQTASPGIFTSGIWRHRKRDGSILHVEILSHEILYKGWRTRFVCPIDVTERLRIEDARARLATALQGREAGLRRVQLMVRLAHVIARSDGTFESWSESLPQLGGLDAPERWHCLVEWFAPIIVGAHEGDRGAASEESERRRFAATPFAVRRSPGSK